MSDNSSSAYVIDANYNILTYNKVAKKTYPQLIKGEKCHKCLMNSDEPCAACPVLNGIEGPRTYLDPIRHIYETVDAVEMILEDGSTGHALILSTTGEREEFARRLPTNEKEFNELYEQEYYDKLTGFFSRKGFIREVRNFLDQSKEPTEYAVIFYNIKNFKAVNEMFGLEGGDSLLKESFRRLLESPLKPLVIARMEADHAVCLVRWENIDFHVLSQFSEIKWTWNNRTIRVHSRCGIYRIESGDMPISLMIDRAHLAKRSIVDEHITPYSIFNTSMKQHYISQAEILADYKNALQKNEFKLYYQPIIDAKTGHIRSAEALIRWEHPTKGLLTPGYFIPLLEKNGHIAKIDWYMIEHISDWISERKASNLDYVPISVNLSWQDFYNDDFIDKIFDHLEQGVLPEGSLYFEVTETSFTALEQNNAELLEKFRSSGSKILLDDFGSGYSSFAMIRDYEFDILKLDMSFIRQIETNAKVRSIIKAMITMCHQLGLKVVAEGIETKEEADFLLENDCDYLQGYYYSKPLSEEQFVKFLATRKK